MGTYTIMAHSGIFRPSNIKKYRGDYRNIIYRSSWEKVFMRYCDKNSNILEWGSEETIIPYRSPLDQRIHRYFPDFFNSTGMAVILAEWFPDTSMTRFFPHNFPHRKHLHSQTSHHKL